MSTNDLPCIGCDTDHGCGTGTGNWPKPGDPDNTAILTAVAVFGGINVTWSYPVINPHAVQHFMLYRGYSSDFSSANLLSIVSGSNYYDNKTVDAGKTIYYWIVIVSVHGTHGKEIGPAYAIMPNLSTDIVEEINGQIEEGVLANSLKTRIAKIETNALDIAKEIQDRIDSNKAITEALSYIKADSDNARTLISEEVTERIDGQNALINQINILAAGNKDNSALIYEEQTARVTADEALGQRINLLSAEFQEEITSAILEERVVRVSAEEALASSINQMAVKYPKDIAAAVQTEATIRANADGALGQRIDLTTAKVANVETAIKEERVARIAGQEALAQQIITTQTSLGRDIASVNTNMQTQINSTNGKVNNIGALWTAKVDVNGYVGGFGVYNDGRTVEAGFDVDRFWIGKANVGGVKPFIVSGNNVYINKAQIKEADIDTLKIAGNAVTIPGGSNGIYKAEVTLYTAYPASFMVIGTLTQGAGRGGFSWFLTSNGNVLTSDNPIQNTVGAMSALVYLGAGTHTFSVVTYQTTGDARCGITVIGVKR